ncbi:MAG: periplasmic heavy metal sensor [Gammaproteobacteria bacterium]|nr:periplasmic heavy metal sensor [Gammaproteobacteria bacterium]
MKLIRPTSFELTLFMGIVVTCGLILIAPADVSAEISRQKPGEGIVEYSSDHQGRHMGHGHHGPKKHPDRKKLLGPHWNSTLLDEQRIEMDGLSVEHVKGQLPLKAKARVLKVELAVLATSDAPDTEAIGLKLDELLTLKRQLMLQKYASIAAKRKVLSPQQRASFDMEVMKSAMHTRGRKGRGH